jgi:hypothetical protein
MWLMVIVLDTAGLNRQRNFSFKGKVDKVCGKIEETQTLKRLLSICSTFTCCDVTAVDVGIVLLTCDVFGGTLLEFDAVAPLANAALIIWKEIFNY